MEEHLKKGIDVLPCNRRSRHRSAVIRIRVAYVDRLVEKDDIGVGVPAVRIESSVATLVGDAAWSKLSKKPGRGAASWSAV